MYPNVDPLFKAQQVDQEQSLYQTQPQYNQQGFQGLQYQQVQQNQHHNSYNQPQQSQNPYSQETANNQQPYQQAQFTGPYGQQQNQTYAPNLMDIQQQVQQPNQQSAYSNEYPQHSNQQLPQLINPQVAQQPAYQNQPYAPNLVDIQQKVQGSQCNEEQEVLSITQEDCLYIERVDDNYVGVYTENENRDLPAFVLCREKIKSNRIFHLEKVNGGRGSVFKTHRLPFQVYKRSHALKNSEYYASFQGQDIAYFHKHEWGDKIRVYSNSSKQDLIAIKKDDFIVDDSKDKIAGIRIEPTISQIDYSKPGLKNTNAKIRLVLFAMLFVLYRKAEEEDDDDEYE